MHHQFSTVRRFFPLSTFSLLFLDSFCVLASVPRDKRVLEECKAFIRIFSKDDSARKGLGSSYKPFFLFFLPRGVSVPCVPEAFFFFFFFFFLHYSGFFLGFFFSDLGGGRKKPTQKKFFFAGASRVSACLHGKFFQNREDMSKKGSKNFALRAKKPVHFT